MLLNPDALKESGEEMEGSCYYLSLPHELSGSRSKNRFRIELLWGISKLLDLMEKDQDFTIVFDYVCDVEIHYKNSFEFYQIKSHKSSNSYTTKKLTKNIGEGSILGKLYVLVKNKSAKEVIVAVVSNVPYKSMPTDKLVNCFTDLPIEEQDKVICALKKELGIEVVSLSNLFYIQVGMNLENPDDDVRGKLVVAFEKIKKCEPKNPNALYRLIVETVTEKACYEYSNEDYDEVIRFKGLTRKQFDELLDLHSEKSKTGINAANKYIESLNDIKKRMLYKRSLSNVLKLLSTSKVIKKIEKDVSKYLWNNEIGDIEHAIELLTTEFNDRFPIEVSTTDKEVFYVVVIKRFEEGVYGYENDI